MQGKCASKEGLYLTKWSITTTFLLVQINVSESTTGNAFNVSLFKRLLLYFTIQVDFLFCSFYGHYQVQLFL
jgi:uncharacterized membrane protein